MKKERTVGKQTYEIGESVRLQNIKTKKWNIFGVVTGIRTSDDGTILSLILTLILMGELPQDTGNA